MLQMKKVFIQAPLRLDFTDAQVINVMSQFQARVAELGEENVTIVCSFADRDGDPRELCDVPEVVEFCKKLVALGFSAFLHASTSCRRLSPEKLWLSTRIGLGAFEIWRIARGGARDAGPLSFKASELQQFFADLRVMRAEVDRRLAVRGGGR
jgi:hypothetical protein